MSTVTSIPADEIIEHLVSAESDIWGLLHKIEQACQRQGYSEFGKSSIMTVASELAHNVVKYATLGYITIRFEQGPQGKRCNLRFRDRGPGIDDIERAMQDHVSSSGTLGLGLPGVRRMADGFQIKSEAGVGTTVEVTIREEQRF